MTREDIYKKCKNILQREDFILLELPTGFGKTKLSIDLANHLLENRRFQEAKTIRILLLVAKRAHKKTWEEEIKKWGGINHATAPVRICMECYESLKNHAGEEWNIIISDEVHHIGSETRLHILRNIKFDYFMGLSATIPFKLRKYLQYNYHSQVVSCTLNEAIQREVLPEPRILLMPLKLDNTIASEYIILNPNTPGKVQYIEYKDIHRCNPRLKTFVACTQKQKLHHLNQVILKEKNRYKHTGNQNLKKIWLYHCGQRLEYLSNCKLPVIHQILEHLKGERTITFCKTIGQCEKLGSNCIHSKNNEAITVYEHFNQQKIDHITAVNILNENANLVNCKYAVFCNLSSSEVIAPQRIGRSLRHPSPVIIIPYYEDTREEEIVDSMLVNFNSQAIKKINSVDEIMQNKNN